jgi:hypothetical protein
MRTKKLQTSIKIKLSRYAGGQYEYDGAKFSDENEFEGVCFAYWDPKTRQHGTPILGNFILDFAIANGLRPGDEVEVKIKKVSKKK